MDTTDKLRRGAAPAAPGVPSEFRASSSALAASTPLSSLATLGTPVQTPPQPDDPFVGWDAGPDPITALCEYGVVGDWELRRDVAEFTIGGSSKCTIPIPGRGLSARHCYLERRLEMLRLHDLNSTRSLPGR